MPHFSKLQSSEPAAQADVLHAAMAELMSEHSLAYFVVSYFPEADKAGLNENILATNWPLQLLNRYEHADMFRQSRIVAGLKCSIEPVSTETLLFARGRGDGKLEEPLALYHDDGFSNTIGFSLHDATCHHYLLMLSGLRKVSSDEEIALIILKAMRALDKFRPCNPVDFGLSQRELECLRWSAAGKSSEEVALILHLSVHTVNSYINLAMRKLDTVNRVQAVAMAGRLRLI